MKVEIEKCNFTNLPPEIISEIFRYLKFAEIENARHACYYFYVVGGELLSKGLRELTRKIETKRKRLHQENLSITRFETGFWYVVPLSKVLQIYDTILTPYIAVGLLPAGPWAVLLDKVYETFLEKSDPILDFCRVFMIEGELLNFSCTSIASYKGETSAIGIETTFNIIIDLLKQHVNLKREQKTNSGLLVQGKHTTHSNTPSQLYLFDEMNHWEISITDMEIHKLHQLAKYFLETTQYWMDEEELQLTEPSFSSEWTLEIVTVPQIESLQQLDFTNQNIVHAKLSVDAKE